MHKKQKCDDTVFNVRVTAVQVLRIDYSPRYIATRNDSE